MYHVLRCGCGSRHPDSFLMSRPEGLPCYVLLIIRCQGSFQIEGCTYQTAPGSALLLAPGTSYSYCNPFGEYIDDWLHFTADDPDTPFCLSSMTNRPFFIGGTDNYTTLIRQISWELLYTPQPYADQSMTALLLVLLRRLWLQLKGMGQHTADNPYKTALQSLRLELQNDFLHTPDIHSCAASLGISESYFQHLYSQTFGISFQQDVITFRIEYAKNLLLTTNLSMEQLAELCGYNSPVHFYRQFKGKTGITPATFRRQHLP